MKDEWLIYRIVFPNGKSYIGLTKDLYNRISCHKRDTVKETHRPLYNAINHFGWDSIKFEEVEIGIPTLERANELEVEYIAKYNSRVENGQGYNCTPGGDGCEGRKLTEEEVEEFRQWSINLWKDPKHREKMTEVARDRVYDEETRAKMSKSAKEKIARNGHTWKGRNHKQESREKMRGPRDKTGLGYYKASLIRSRKVYCSDLDFVFFSIELCAKYIGITKSSLSKALQNPDRKKYKSLSYYN